MWETSWREGRTRPRLHLSKKMKTCAIWLLTIKRRLVPYGFSPKEERDRLVTRCDKPSALISPYALVVFFNFVGGAGAIKFLAYRLKSLLNRLNSIQAVINGVM